MTIPEDITTYCRNHQIIPLKIDQQTLFIAATEPLSDNLSSSLRFISQRQVAVEIWPREKFNLAWKNQSSQPDALSHEGTESSVIGYINNIISHAIKNRASDIHFEPYADYYRIRLRVDGVLQEIASPSIELSTRLVARLKIMAKLNIAEYRLPQDGQFAYQNRALRISTLPVHRGEKVVLRILENSQQELNINELGFTDAQLKIYLKGLNSSQGMILVTGPTGSGKSITLYNGLKHINRGERNICSVEDPIELPINGVNQTQINPKAGLLFSNTLRALLRQDPDVLMIGEIRDKETAKIAIEAALTGHLVLSTLHTNSTCETIIRLQQMGIANYLLASSIKLIIAQRLLRRLCSHCRQKNSDLFICEMGAIESWSAKGCQFCIGGYRGRVAIYELLVINSAIEEAILKNSAINELITLTHQQKIPTLQQNGLLLAKQGITSIDELYRVIDYDT